MRRIALATCLTALSIPAAAADLTLHRVMLSAAGVGYFEYGAHADGPAAIGLDIPLTEIDDVLNSLAIFDDHGGVGTIDLPGRDDSHAAFAGVPFTAQTLDAPPLALLNALRGKEIDVGPPAAMTGRIVNALTEAVTTPQNTPRRAAFHTRVTLLTADGMRQFILEDAAAIRFTDPGLRARVGAALDAARQHTAAAMRHLTLHSTGNGARDMTVGYVVAAPLWKATYRLILPAKTGEKARVQGWAVLENQSGADWKAVDLTLQSGNPVTFRQAIYASYYADRPEVPVDVLGRILPDADQSESVIVKAQQRMLREKNAPGGAPEAYQPPPQSMAVMSPQRADMPAPALAEPATQTEATETLLDTTFHIATPVDLAQGHTASVPILDTAMPAGQLDWLQPYSTRPVSAVRLTNTGAASLPPGVLTFYTESAAGAAFAGDARLSGLPAGESRLLAFAEDLRLHATRETSAKPAQLMHVSIAKGVLRRTLRDRVTYTVGLIAPPHDARRVLVEFPKTPGAAFSIEGAAIPGQEETATAWRIPIDLKAGETRRITAYADTTESTSETLLADDGSFDDAVLAEITADGNLDPAARAALQPLIALHGALSDKQAAVKKLTDQQTAITADETRLQNNLRVVFGPGDLHEKLLAELDADETTLGTLKTALAQARKDADAAHTALADAAAKLEL